MQQILTKIMRHSTVRFFYNSLWILKFDCFCPRLRANEEKLLIENDVILCYAELQWLNFGDM